MSIQIDRRPSDTLVVGATGFGKGFGLGSIEGFYGAAGLQECSRITISDFSRRFFLRGLHPDFPTFADFLAALKREVSSLAPARLIVTGGSAGGHTALLLGHLLRADLVVAFAPFTYLSEQEARRAGDAGIERTYAKRPLSDELDELSAEVRSYLDLRPVLAEWNGTTRYMLHVPRYREWDVRRAEYLRGVPHLAIHRHPYGAHTVARWLAYDGLLHACFEYPYRRPPTLKHYWRHLEGNPATKQLIPLLNQVRKTIRRCRPRTQLLYSDEKGTRSARFADEETATKCAYGFMLHDVRRIGG